MSDKYTLQGGVALKDFIIGLSTPELEAFKEITQKSMIKAIDIPTKLKAFLLDRGVMQYSKKYRHYELTHEAKTYQLYDVGLIHEVLKTLNERSEKKVKEESKNRRLGG